MKVKNKSCIRRLSFRQLKASGTRNVIAVFAIALTTLLFTSLFTIALSLNSSYEEYNFRQMGGYSHGTFKEVDEEKIKALSGHRKVKEYGLRTTCGFTAEEPFAKIPAEISWMDANTTKWSYAVPTTGRMPEKADEVTLDTEALRKLGVPAKIREKVELRYFVGGVTDAQERADVFTLVGFYEYDDLMPCHYVNVSQEYIAQVEADFVEAGGEPFRTDMNVMLPSSLHIRSVMESIDTELGYQWENREAENCVRIGTNWGVSAAGIGETADPETVVLILAFLLLVIFTGYLIIYNIFQISVSNDIRFYGLLKTIGTTPRQIRRMVRLQALALSLVGIPLGCIAGYGIGVLLVPKVLSGINTAVTTVKLSASPLIFIGAAAFSLLTVWISCSKPGRQAAKITPVEAVRYTENVTGKRKKRATRGAKIWQMALANLGRNRRKTVLVILSLSLSVVLLNVVAMFANGFDMEKYVSSFSTADFIVGTTEYFRYDGDSPNAALPEETIREIRQNTEASGEGAVYVISDTRPRCWITEEDFYSNSFLDRETLKPTVDAAEKRNGLLAATLLLEGMEESLFEKLTVHAGDLSALSDPEQNAIALAVYTDDYGNVSNVSIEPGDTLTVSYVDEGAYFSTKTGELANENTPEEEIEYRIIKGHDVDYTVCALVEVPYDLSFRFSTDGYEAVISKDALLRDGGESVQAMYYMIDTPDDASEAEAEQFLADYTEGESSGLMYESKAGLRARFEGFRRMFLLVGGVLCVIVGIVGVLNFFNAILTGIVTRRREFAMLQSVGMTGKQLKQMLVMEGLFYAAGTGIVVLALTLLLNPLFAGVIQKMFWFFTYRFTIAPVLIVLPLFALLGIVLPLVIYRFAGRKSIVERLRETES